MNTTYSISEFSQITGLSVKTLRFYHEKGLLLPSSVDPATGYRFYAAEKIEKARVIRRLRAMEFSLEDIAAVLGDCDDEADILAHLERQKSKLQQRVAEDREIIRSIAGIVAREQEARRLLAAETFPVEEKQLEPILVAGIRVQGHYSDCGEVFARLGQAVGRHIAGKPICLHHVGEYRDGDADFEPCFPIRREISAEGISIQTLPGGPALTLTHRGPYDQLGRSYARILAEARRRSLHILLPTRESYIKGPGMIFKGNPKNYLTEIILPTAS